MVSIGLSWQGIGPTFGQQRFTIESDPKWRAMAREINGEYRDSKFAVAAQTRRLAMGYTDWSDLAPAKRPPVRWETNDAKSADYGHLGQPISPLPFKFDAKVLQYYVALNRFDLLEKEKQKYCLFGLRGAAMVRPGSSFVSDLDVKEVYPDHTTLRCLIGVWDRQSDTIRVFHGSTVPNADHMARQAFEAACYNQSNRTCPVPPSVANMKPPGLYRYVVGTHQGEQSKLPNAFVDAAECFVRRSYDDLIFTVDDWGVRPEIVGDNLHCAYYDINPDGVDGVIFFSSAGCQTVAGAFYQGEHNREWAELIAAVGRPGDKTEFDYLLLSGREARLISESSGNARYKRLRFGSSGDPVDTLRKSLNLPSDKKKLFDAQTAKALVDWQRKLTPPAPYGLLDLPQAKRLGITL